MKFTPESPKNKGAGEPYLSPEEDDDSSTWEWFDPPENSAPVQFCNDTSLHGLQYLGQKNRHLSERLFWLTAFITAVTTATVLIYNMWQSYVEMPIVTVFNPSEVTLGEIPFPSVTVCNVNNVQKRKVEELRQKALQGIAGNLSESDYMETLAEFLDIRNICEGAKSFTEQFLPRKMFEDNIDEIIANKIKELEILLSPHKTLRKYSQSCEEMILFCTWKNVIKNCSKLFKEVYTDFGYCCTFNTIPISLLLKNSDDGVDDSRDDPAIIEEWRKENLTVDNLLFDNEHSKNRTYPYRQNYPGRSSGLSFLVDPDLEEYYCTNTDSEGYVIGLNGPLDFPRMKHNGVAIQTGSEVFISVRPEITMSDARTRLYDLDKRKCYFGTEYTLPNYIVYTPSNCMGECLAWRTKVECDCLRYYMPGYGTSNGTLCKPDKYQCAERVRTKSIQNGTTQICYKCLATCSEINYNSETTTLKIRDEYMQNLFDYYPQHSKSRNTSVVHVYFDVDSTYPRLRKEMNTMIGLISSAGGLLGLCLGFSMLSLLEIIYYATIRLFWTSYRGRRKERKKGPNNGFGCCACGNHGSPEKMNQDDIHTITLSQNNTEKCNGFLGKVFPNWFADNRKRRQKHARGNNNSNESFKTSRVTRENNVTNYFQTNYEAEFQSTHNVAKAWENMNMKK